jgi:hypothetical protein
MSHAATISLLPSSAPPAFAYRSVAFAHIHVRKNGKARSSMEATNLTNLRGVTHNLLILQGW